MLIVEFVVVLGDADVGRSDVKVDVAGVVEADFCAGELGELSVVPVVDGFSVVAAVVSVFDIDEAAKAKTTRTVTDLVANILEDKKCTTEEAINNSHKKNFTAETLETVRVKRLKITRFLLV